MYIERPTKNDIYIWKETYLLLLLQIGSQDMTKGTKMTNTYIERPTKSDLYI